MILPAKRIMQELCRGSYGWDSEILPTVAERWETWIGGLNQLTSLNIRRCYRPQDFGEVCDAQLHHFFDATEVGYGTASYMKLTNTRGFIVAAHTLTRTKQYEHVSPVLASQHWCPVKSRSDVKVFCLSSKWLSSKLPQEMSCPLIPTNKFPECISPCYSKSIKKHNKRQSLLLLSPPPVE